MRTTWLSNKPDCVLRTALGLLAPVGTNLRQGRRLLHTLDPTAISNGEEVLDGAINVGMDAIVGRAHRLLGSGRDLRGAKDRTFRWWAIACVPQCIVLWRG